jgi:hypothetical protein
VYAGVVTGWTSDTLAGPAFRLVNTIVVPEPAASGELLPAARLEPGGERRASFLADSARPFVVRASTWSPLQAAVAYLHEPDGMPYRNGQQLEVGADSGAGVFRVDARDVVPGAYELVLGGFPVGVATVSARVAQAPFRVAARASGDAVTAALSNVTSAPVRARLGLAAAGAEREQPIESRGGDTVRIPLRAPGWARLATVDIMMDPAQWERFTDFGMTLVDSTGAQVGKLPLNYAVGRLRTAVSPTAGGLPLELQLFPGLAEPGSTEAWRARVTVRFYPDSAGRLAAAAQTPTAVELSPRESRSVSLTAPAPVGPPGEGFRPLLVLVARVGEERWTREFAAQE